MLLINMIFLAMVFAILAVAVVAYVKLNTLTYPKLKRKLFL